MEKWNQLQKNYSPCPKRGGCNTDIWGLLRLVYEIAHSCAVPEGSEETKYQQSQHVGISLAL